MGCDGGVRKTYAGPTGHCWGSGSWGRAPGVYPDDLALYGYSSPDGKAKDLNRRNSVYDSVLTHGAVICMMKMRWKEG